MTILLDYYRLTAFGIRLFRQGSSGGFPRSVQEFHDLEVGSNAAYDLYLPKNQIRNVVIAVHGITPLGRRDRRLIHFARCLAKSGTACVVPTLPRLSACLLPNDDIDEMCDVVRAVREKLNLRPGIIGFSFGGSVAILAAGREQIRDDIRFVMAFGAYHSLEWLFEWYAKTQSHHPKSQMEWDSRIYLHLVLLKQLDSSLNLSESTRRSANDLLLRYCTEASDDEKLRFYEQHLSELDLVKLAAEANDKETLRAASPAGQLGRIECPVHLIHDQNDKTIPPQQSASLFEELKTRHPAGNQSLCITDQLSHVSLGNVFNVRKMYRLFQAIRWMVR